MNSFQKEIIDIFVNSVYVYDDKLLLTYNYKNGTQTLSLDEIHAVLGSDIEHGTLPKILVRKYGDFYFFTINYSLIFIGEPENPLVFGFLFSVEKKVDSKAREANAPGERF